MTSPLFKRAFVRGLNAELVRAGAASFPTKEAADYIADYVADNSGMPDPVENPDALTKEAALTLCNELIEASNQLHTKLGGFSNEFSKTAASWDPVDVANHDAWNIMEKCAAETGSLMEGGDNPNDQPAAAENNEEAALEQNRRPENYANLGERGVGNYERKGQGNVGTEETHPEAPKATESGSNSVIQNSKQANDMAPMPPGGDSEEGAEGGGEEVTPDVIKGLELGLRLAQEDPEGAAQLLAAHDQELEQMAASSGQMPEMPGGGGGGAPMAAEPPMAPEPKQASDMSFTQIVQKIANTGSLITGGNAPNTLSAAAAHNNEAALELQRRPEGYAHVGEDGVGNTAFKAPATAIVGTEQPHPLKPKATDGGSNSITSFSKKAFDQIFSDTAQAVVPYLPTRMEDNQKVAHVRATMGLSNNERADYLEDLYLSLGAEKTAAANLKVQFLKSAEETPAAAAPAKQTKQASTKSLSNLKLALSRLNNQAS